MDAEDILTELAPGLPESRFRILFSELEQEVNRLIVHDFQKLVQILYRMDVSEIKLKQLLASGSRQDAATIISQQMIERQLEKLKTREQFKNESPPTDEERW